MNGEHRRGPSESSVSKVSIRRKKFKLIASCPLCTVHLVIGCAGQPTQAVTPPRTSLSEAKWCLRTFLDPDEDFWSFLNKAEKNVIE